MSSRGIVLGREIGQQEICALENLIFRKNDDGSRHSLVWIIYGYLVWNYFRRGNYFAIFLKRETKS